MDYKHLSESDRQGVIQQRLRQYEGEHFSHSLLLDQLLASGSDDEQTQQAIANSENAMKILDDAHSHLLSKLAASDN